VTEIDQVALLNGFVEEHGEKGSGRPRSVIDPTQSTRRIGLASPRFAQSSGKVDVPDQLRLAFSIPS
jgi:hypothetical protein